MATPIVYVGAAATHSTAAFRGRVAEFKRQLREAAAAVVLEWAATQDIDHRLFERDLSNIRAANMIIALIDEPSIGLGMEIAEAMRHSKPILCLHHRPVTPSRLLQAAAFSGLVECRPYSTLHEAVTIAGEFVSRHAARYNDAFI